MSIKLTRIQYLHISAALARHGFPFIAAGLPIKSINLTDTGVGGELTVESDMGLTQWIYFLNTLLNI